MGVVKGCDGVIRGAKIKLGKSGAIVSRPLNKIYPLEVNKNLTREIVLPSQTVGPPRREASVIGELTRKFQSHGVCCL